MPKKFKEVKNQPKIDAFFHIRKCESGLKSETKMSQKRQSPITDHFIKKFKAEIAEQEKDTENVLESSYLTQEFDIKLENSFDNSLHEISIKSADSTTHNDDEPKQSQFLSPKKSSQSPNKSSFTPKRKVPESKVTPKKSSRRILQNNVDEEKMLQAIENMNNIKERSTECFEFELEKIYSSNSFEHKYSELDTTLTTRYEIGDIVLPRETYADHLFKMIAEVFSNKINCEYFTKEELDVVYSYLCLKAGAQIAFTKLLKRKRDVHRVKTMVHVTEDLKPFFKDLVEHKFLSSDLSNYDTEKLLNLLQSPEIKQLSQVMLRNGKSNKKDSITSLMKLANNRKSIFGGKSPADKLRQQVLQLVDTCVYIPEDILGIFDRIFTLFLPCDYPINMAIQDIFFMMLEMDQEKYKYYYLPTERYPVFRNRDHLVSFVESQLTYAQAIQASEQKQWDVVIDLGKLAFDKFQEVVENTIADSSQILMIPRHVARFSTGNTWGKVIWHSVAALKKSKETMSVAERYIKYLLEQHDYAQNYRGKWYNELALIKSFHQKDNETAVKLLFDALSSRQEFADRDQTDLIDKLKSYSKKKNSFMCPEFKSEVELLLKELEGRLPQENFQSITITGKKINRHELSQGKSKWEVSNDQKSVISSVEYVAADYYKEQGFSDSLHCEGALPVSLFVLFFWEELFGISVPGAFVSSYQDAPLDLFTSKFYENRKSEIDKKIKHLAAKDHVEFVEHMTEQYVKYKHYKTIFPDIYDSDEQFKNMVYCLGFHAICTMSKKLLESFRLWKSGFPDLIVWDTENQSYKISEVKGPKDTLSSKQRLWMQYLQDNGVCVELCLVKAE